MRHEVEGFVWVSQPSCLAFFSRMVVFNLSVIVPPVGIISMKLMRPSTCGRSGS